MGKAKELTHYSELGGSYLTISTTTPLSYLLKSYPIGKIIKGSYQVDSKNVVILTQLIQIHLSRDKNYRQNTPGVQKKTNSSDVYVEPLWALGKLEYTTALPFKSRIKFSCA
ncbi:uncharacterized protein VK521_017990 [Ammospiza maritima maritima]